MSDEYVAREVQNQKNKLCLMGRNMATVGQFGALGYKWPISLTYRGIDVSAMVKTAQRENHLSQEESTRPAGVARTTIARMETLAKSNMSVSVRVRLFEAAGYDLKFVAYRSRTDTRRYPRMPDAELRSSTK